MPWPTIPKDYDFKEARPAEVVQVIDVYLRRQQQLHGLHVRTFTGRNQRIATEAIAHGKVRTLRDHLPDDVSSPEGASKEPRRVLIGGLRINVAPRIDERDC